MYLRVFSLPAESFFLFGARGTGKTSLLSKLIPAALTVDLLSEEGFLNHTADSGLLRRQMEGLPEKAWVWIDEIQRVPNLLNEVHWAIEKKKLRFALSGSSARKLRKSGVNLLGGRAASKTLFPLIPAEMKDDYALDRALQFGTIPLVLAAADPKQRLRAYVHTYLQDEVQREALVRDLPSFLRFLKVAALLHGQELSLSSVARDVGVKRPTVENYFSILEDTLLAHRLMPFEAGLRVKEKKHPKLYWIDPGLTRALREEWGEPSAADRGPLFEGLIFTLLKAYQSYEDAFDELYFWSTPHLEVDFLVKKNSTFHAIEVKSSPRFRREDLEGLRAIAELPRLKTRTLVYPTIDTQKTDDGIDIVGFAEFNRRLALGF